jgi:hypothetical protein
MVNFERLVVKISQHLSKLHFIGKMLTRAKGKAVASRELKITYQKSPQKTSREGNSISSLERPKPQ